MATASYLFDVDSYSAKKRPSRRFAEMPPGVRFALLNLKRTIDSISAEEWELRRKRWEELQKSLQIR